MRKSRVSLRSIIDSAAAAKTGTPILMDLAALSGARTVDVWLWARQISAGNVLESRAIRTVTCYIKAAFHRVNNCLATSCNVKQHQEAAEEMKAQLCHQAYIMLISITIEDLYQVVQSNKALDVYAPKHITQILLFGNYKLMTDIAFDCEYATLQFYQMKIKMRNKVFKKMGKSSVHNEGGLSFDALQDEEQNQGLANRSHINKLTYKYLQKIEKAGDVIKEARHINNFRAQFVKNGGTRKNMIKKEFSESAQMCENQQQQTSKLGRDLYSLISHQQENCGAMKESNIDTKMQSRVRENVNQLEQTELPVEITEGEMSKSILSIDYSIVKNYFKGRMLELDACSTPERIYKIFNPFYELCGMNVPLPLVKRYKNCAYFGDSHKKATGRYEGFLIFHQENKLYFGEFLNEKKDGKGTQIDFKANTVFIGTFSKGRKGGVFTVVRSNEKYVGRLRNGLYDGYGELTTNFSSYKGQFEKGQRHGEGQETFLGMGLTISGTFVNNKFTNKVQKVEESRLKSINSHDYSVQAERKKNGKAINPERLCQTLQQSRKKTFEVFDCDFVEEEEEVEDIQTIRLRKAPAFRIKQGKDIRKSFTQRKRASSETKDAYLYSTLKH